ncbi:MAG: hypothetical protein QOF14_1831 [Hyphomicrobiales bacterium]|nr:hypothetical protein [Hyphomicrobiales bacterium]
MSVQPPAAPHRVAIADVDIPFWRAVAIIIKWMFAAIPAAIIFSIIITLISIAIMAIFGSMLGGLNIPGMKM